MDGSAVGRHPPPPERIAEREHRGELPPVLGGDAQQVHDLLLSVTQHRGDDAADPFGARGKRPVTVNMRNVT
jgi:hypothetical protein